jgi:hypothetical protein
MSRPTLFSATTVTIVNLFLSGNPDVVVPVCLTGRLPWPIAEKPGRIYRAGRDRRAPQVFILTALAIRKRQRAVLHDLSCGPHPSSMAVVSMQECATRFYISAYVISSFPFSIDGIPLARRGAATGAIGL